MPTFTQAILLGAERLHAPPAAPHAALLEAWSSLDWSTAKEAALLEASALIGTARAAGSLTGPSLPPPEIAPPDTQPLAPPGAVALLRQLIAEEWRALLPEWLELCAQHGARVPPFFLRTLFEIVATSPERALLLRSVGERGRWLARQHAEWAWVNVAERRLDESLWETGTEEERLAILSHVRVNHPARSVELLDKTWSDETPEFRARALGTMASTLSPSDEPLLARALAERRKDIRSVAQSLLATLPTSGLATRMRARADELLTQQRGILSKKLDVTLPAAFDPAWKTDAIEEKPPAGVGEKAHWTQQILGLVPLAYWTEKFDLDAASLVALALKSGDWTDLLLGAWFRSACVHRDAAASAALLRPLMTRPKALPSGTPPQTAATALLAVCHESERWRIAAAEPELAWSALALLTGTPSPEEGRALFEHLAPALRDGFNPGGSPIAVLAARRVPPELRELAAHRLTRDNGLSKPAETFLRALELRAALHAAFPRSAQPSHCS